MADDGQHLNTTEARGGETPGVMRYVLGISLATIIILFAVVLLIWR